MTNLTICLIGRLACCALATSGAIYLASQGLDGWGWLIFLALYLGSILVTDKDPQNET